MQWFSRRIRLMNGMILIGMMMGWSYSAVAQRRPIADETLGNERSRVVPIGSDPLGDRIEGGAQRGANLFHSFQEFQVDEGRSVYFSDPGVENIFSRVTGGVESQILGVLGVRGNANLFLINPSGIIFGRNAQLDLRGSFTATTANAVQFGERGFFTTVDPTSPSLLTVQPSAFLFNQLNPAAIVNNSTVPAAATPSGIPEFGLRVPERERLTLLGGDVRLNGGGLTALGGRAEVGGLSQPGSVTLNADGSLGFPTGMVRADVSLTNRARINVVGEGGSITVNAGNFEMLNSFLSAGIGVNSGFVGAQAGDITLNTSAMRGVEASIANRVRAGAVGNAGDIRITVDSLSLTNGAQLDASTRGQGNAGSVILNVRDRVYIDGIGSGIVSNVDRSSGAIAIGNGGDIRIATDSLSLTNGAQLQAVTFGQGNAGNVIIHSHDRVSLDGVSSTNPQIRSGILSSVETLNSDVLTVGNGGNIRITTGSLSLTNGAGLSASTGGQGNAGSVILNVRDRISLDNGRVGSSVGAPNSNVLAAGNGGNIRITTGSLSLINGSQLSVSTFGRGDAGNVIIHARDRVSLERVNAANSNFSSSILSSVGTPNANRAAVGNGGDIRITTGSLSLTNGSQLVASTLGQGNAGNIFIHARDRVFLSGASPTNPAQFTTIFSTVGAINSDALAVGNSGNIRITAGSLTLSDTATITVGTSGQGDAGNIIIRTTTGSFSLINGAQLIASTSGQGNAGNIVIRAHDRVSLEGVSREWVGSSISSSTRSNAQGRGGEISIVADSVVLTDGGIILSSTRNRFPGGTITLNANTIEATGGGQVVTATDGKGQAGNIILNATDRVTFSGFNPNYNELEPPPSNAPISNQGAASGLYATTTRNSSGRGGTVQTTTGQLQVFDRARIAVDSQGSGIAGGIDLTAATVQLDDRARITAESTAVDGGNIILRDVDLLQLRNRSLISTTAGTDRAGGNGGNIDIDADFIVSAPNENSDIRANAFTGRGGNVRIDSEGLFSIGAQPQGNPVTNDITASSERGVQGTVDITPVNTDLRQGVTELPVTVVDASNQITQTCSGQVDSDEFVITGRGGLPSSPLDSLIGDESWIGWATLDENDRREAAATTSPRDREATATAAPIIEAQGWTIDENGKVNLVAATPVSSAQSKTCR
jgi:filamentous hemagglutinin family protein